MISPTKGGNHHPHHHPDLFGHLTASILESLHLKRSLEKHGKPHSKFGRVTPSRVLASNSTVMRSGHSANSSRSSRRLISSRTGGRAAAAAMEELDFSVASTKPVIASSNSPASPRFSNGGMTANGMTAPASKLLRSNSVTRMSGSTGSHQLLMGDDDLIASKRKASEILVKPRGHDEGDQKSEDEIDDDDEEEESEFEDGFKIKYVSEAQEESYFAQHARISDFKVHRRHVIHPHGRTRAMWDTFLLLLLTWVLFAVPFELCFQEVRGAIRRDILRADLFVDVMFAVDIFLNFNTGIEDSDGKLHFSFRSIYRHYTRGWFMLDLLWTFPFYAIFENKDAGVYTNSPQSAVFLFAEKYTDLYTLARCFRFLRVMAIPRIQRRLEYSLLISSKISSLGSFLYIVLALSHVFSCIFAYLAFATEEQISIAIDARSLENHDLHTKYIAACYWSMMTMTTVGYGDLTVKTNAGRMFALGAMVVGGGIFAYGITNVVSLFQQLYIAETEHRHKMDQVNTFMQNRMLPRKLRDEVRAHIFHWRKATRENKTRDKEIFYQMSHAIQFQIATLFCEDMMPHRMPFLAGSSAEFIHELYLSMEVKCYLPGDDIIRQEEYGSEIYFLFVGHVQVFLGHTKVAAIGPNSWFGEFGILNPKKPRMATIRAIDFCETHCVDRQTTLQILLHHPFMLRSLKQLATVRSKKALNLLNETGGKSRTLLQGLAMIWRNEGMHALLPNGVDLDSVLVLQEFMTPNHSSVSTPLTNGGGPLRRGSLSQQQQHGGARISRLGSALDLNLDETGNGVSLLNGNSTSRRNSVERKVSLELLAMQTSMDNHAMHIAPRGIMSEKSSRFQITDFNSSVTAKEEERTIMTLLEQVIKRQEILEEQMRQIIAKFPRPDDDSDELVNHFLYDQQPPMYSSIDHDHGRRSHLGPIRDTYNNPHHIL